MSLPGRRRSLVVAIAAAAALMLAVSASAADRPPACLSELRRTLPGVGTGDAVIAVELLERAVRLVEPAFPALRGGAGPIPAGEEGAEAARFLHRRFLLPDGWSPGTHDDDAWRAMLRAFAVRYRAEAPHLVGSGRAGMVGDAARTLEAISGALRPLPVFATDAEGRVTFFAVIWNWTPAPRLIIVRPREGLALAQGRNSAERAAPVLEAMSTCAVRYRSFVFATEEVALRIFVDQGESIMRVLGSEPPDGGWPLVIPAERVVAAFRFDDPALTGLDTISVSIEGPSIGITTAIGVLAAVRTNLGIDDVFYHLAFP